MGKRNKSTGPESLGIAFCPGYVDEYGQWNNGFTCPKWSTSITQRYCCGSQYKRYCCTPGEEPSTTPTTGTSPFTTPLPVKASQLENIPLVVGFSVGGVVLFIVFLVLCCFLCPCCLMSRNRNRKRPLSVSEGSLDRNRDMRRRSDISSHTLRTSVNTQFTATPSRGESPPPMGITQLPLMIDRHGLETSPAHRNHPCQNNYRGVVIGTVPPYMREEPPPYPHEVLDGIKPITCGQLHCCSKNCLHHTYSDCCQKSCSHQKTRLPEVCAHEEVDPLIFHVSQNSPVTNLHPNPSQVRYGRAHSPRPVSPSPGHIPNPCRHLQIQNRYAM